MADDPRSQLPDVVITAEDGSEWLVRWRRLIIDAERDGALQITGAAELCPVGSWVDEDHVRPLPVAAPLVHTQLPLSRLPPELALAVAQHMVVEAQAQGAELVTQLYQPKETYTPPDAGPDPVLPDFETKELEDGPAATPSEPEAEAADDRVGDDDSGIRP